MLCWDMLELVRADSPGPFVLSHNNGNSALSYERGWLPKLAVWQHAMQDMAVVVKSNAITFWGG